MIRHLVFLFILVITFTTCKKEDSYLIEGQVRDAVTGLPVSGAAVNISSSKIDQFVYNSGFKTLAITSSDPTGNFQISIPIEKAAEYKISGSKSDYYFREYSFTQDEIVDNKYNIQIDITPEAFIRIVTKNINPYSINDKVEFWYEGDTEQCYDCCNNNHYTYVGANVNDSITCKTIGGRYAYVNFISTKNNQTSIRRDSVMCLTDKINVLKYTY